MREKIADGQIITLGGSVACNGCTACCKKEVVVLFPDKGDRVETYDTVEVQIAGESKTRHALRHRDNGDCVYLGESGCTIHDRLPTVCREFDCRMYFLIMDRPQRRQHARAAASGINNREEIFRAARQRLHTLTPEQRQFAMYARSQANIQTPEEASKDEHRFAGEFEAAMKKASTREG